MTRLKNNPQLLYPTTMDNFEKYYQMALRYLSFRFRSEKEIKDYLIKKKANELLIAKVIDVLKEQKLLDDLTFAKAWYQSRTKYKIRSTKIIQLELKQKGINSEIIDKVTKNDNEEYVSEEEMATELVKEKLRIYNNLLPSKRYEKLIGLLKRRGFNWSIISEVLKPYKPS